MDFLDFLLSMVTVVVSYFLFKKNVDFKKIFLIVVAWGIIISIPDIIDTFENLSVLYAILVLVTGIIIPSIIIAFIYKFSYKASTQSFIMYFLISGVLGWIFSMVYKAIIQVLLQFFI